jgi:hypothetical protein
MDCCRPCQEHSRRQLQPAAMVPLVVTAPLGNTLYDLQPRRSVAQRRSTSGLAALQLCAAATAAAAAAFAQSHLSWP